MKLHHVQVSMPRGEESSARRFYAEAIGLSEVDRPAALATRGGCWFRAFDGERVIAEIHLGVQEPFAPATKAHPALVVGSLAELEATASRSRGSAARSPGGSGTLSRASSAFTPGTPSAIGSRS